MRLDRQSIPIVVLAIAALLVFGAFVLVNLSNREDDGDLVRIEESAAQEATDEATAEATESDNAPQTTAEPTGQAPDEATEQASAQPEAAQTREAGDAGEGVAGPPTPTSRSRAADSILIGTQATPLLESTAVPQGDEAEGSVTPTSMSRSTRSIVIGTQVTPVLEITIVRQNISVTTTPTSMSRVTQSILLDAQTTAASTDATQAGSVPEPTAEATPEATAEATAGGAAVGGTAQPPDTGLPFAGRDDAPSVLQPRGPVAAQQASLWWIMFAVGSVIYLGVMAFVLHIVHKRRREREYIPSNRQALGLIVGGGVALPLVVVTLLFVLTIGAMAVLALNDQPAELTIEVTGWQWWWEVRYPEHGIVTANEIHIPVGQRVRFNLTSGDVIHSFWVPELGGKTDLISGNTNTMWLQADVPGEYRGQCAEFCGRQHAKMAFFVIAHEQAEFDAWMANQQQEAREPSSDRVARGQAVFLNSACIGCHAVRGTNAQGAQGPDLTHFGSRRTLGAGAAPNTDEFLAQWIINSQVIKPGNLMPPQDIPAEDLPPLIAYLHSLE